MKPFTIRKANRPGYDEQYQDAKDGYDYEEEEKGSNEFMEGLTPKEEESLKPKPVKVVNPWIHEATHKEFLEGVKGLPARHAQVIKKHKNVVREKTFIHKMQDGQGQQDEQTQEGLKLLDDENKIFTDPNLPSTRALQRFDTWDEQKDIDQWLAIFKSKPDEPHGLSPVYEDNEYIWKPVSITGYDAKSKKWEVIVCHTGQKKLVNRLSLQFLDEDPNQFNQRVQQCKIMQSNVEAELRFSDLVDSISVDEVSVLSKERRYNFLRKSVRESDKYNLDKVYNTFKHLIKVVEQEYIRQMKKCIILKDMQTISTHPRYEQLKVPIRLPQRTAPYYGVVPIPKFDVQLKLEEIMALHWSSSQEQVGVTKKLAHRSIQSLQYRYMNTKKSSLKLPKELSELESIQRAHHEAIKQNISVQWREYFVAEIQDDLKQTHNFYESSFERYKESSLKKIVTRFELLLHTYMREFTKQSIDDWVWFIKSFTVPNYDNDELWSLSKEPMLVIHLRLNEVQKSKKKKKKDSPKKDEEEKPQIAFKPSLDECADFFRKAFDNIITATNKVRYLEADLMPFLKKNKQEDDVSEEEEAEDENTQEKDGKKAKKEKEKKKEKEVPPDDNVWEEPEVDENGEFIEPKTGPNFRLDSEFPWIVEGLAEVNRLIEENVIDPQKLLEQYQEFEEISMTSKTQKIRELFNDNKSPIEDIRAAVEFYDKAYYDIINLSNNTVDFRLFRVEAGKLKYQLADKALKIRDAILKAANDYCAETITAVLEKYAFMRTKIRTEPKDEAQLVDIRQFIEDSPKMIADQEAKVHEVSRHLNLLEDYCVEYPDLESKKFWNTKTWPLEISADITIGNMEISKQEAIFSERLENEKIQFSNELLDLKQNLEKIKTFNNLEQARVYSGDSYNLKDRLEKADNLVQEFNKREELFDLKVTEYPELEQIKTEFAPYHELTTMAYDVEFRIKDWKTGTFIKLDAGEIEKSVNQWYGACNQLFKKLIEDNPDTAETAQHLKANIEDFRKHMPLIKYMSSEAILEEDWDQIRKAVHQESLERDELQIIKMIELDFGKYINEIEEIVTKAEKKFSLRNRLKEMIAEMKEFQLEIFPHKSGTWVLKGYDDIYTVLDDQTVATQTMLGSQFMDGSLRKEAKAYERRLNDMSELIEEIAKCQRTWMYLEPIFSSPDIKVQLPDEYNLFEEVDTTWRKTMEDINEIPGIIDLQEREIKPAFEKANQNLDEIQSSLNDYLEQKRQVFSRFYFLANEDLLMILAQTKEPRAVQPHMDKCFEGISRLVFTKSDEIVGMTSAEQEEVTFIKKIDVNEGDKKGNIEKWLLETEGIMVKSLKDQCKESLQDFIDVPRTDWVKKWPGQIILAVDQIYWTEGVEKAISNFSLDEYHQELADQILEIVKMVRGDLSAQIRMTLKALVVIDVHARDVVHGLVTKNIKSVEEFDWKSQLRYYWELPSELKVEMVNAKITYGFEYLGNSPRLVITPLTDRCYRTLMGAKELNYGGAPEGPAGTGKTESVKDLAKAIAVQCVVFNCSDGLNFMAMAKFFKGLASSGAWCCFDEFNRINLEVLSVIAQQILVIQRAIDNPRIKDRFQFDGTELKLNRQCAVNITMNPGYAGRSELPDNLKALFRSCAMMVPDYNLIAEIELYSFGFSEAKKLSVKVVASLRLSSEQLSSQDHYDFGMRALKAILTACGNLRRTMTSAEDLIGLRALYDVNIPKFTSNDIPLFLGITRDLFPGIELPDPDYGRLLEALNEQSSLMNLQATDAFIKKCIQLYETIMVRHGLMLVGEAYSGKSKVLSSLQKAFTSLKDDPKFEIVETHFINPKSITQDELYGKHDLDTGEWTDGVLAIKIRECAESSTPNRKWVVFDGPVDAVWIENMNTVLDDNKKLCLNSGQIIKLKPTMTIMFEVADLAVASPATVSRCGMVFLEPVQLGSDVLIHSYANSKKKYLEKHIDLIRDTLLYYSKVCIAWKDVHGKLPQPHGNQQLVQSMLNIFDSFISEYLPQYADQEEATFPLEIGEMIPNIILFALIWSFGGAFDEQCRPAFDSFLQEIIIGEDMQEKFGYELEEEIEPLKLNAKLPEFKSLFEIFYDKYDLKWLNFNKTIPPYEVPKGEEFNKIIVPTIDSIRISKLVNILLNNDQHTLLVGPTGTGKTISVVTEMNDNFDPQKYANQHLSFSAQTSAYQTQFIIDETMKKRRKGVYGPPANKKGIIYVDDLNMPQKEKFGAQPPIELLRQWMDYGGWYNVREAEREFMGVVDIKFVSAMQPPGGGRNEVTYRYIRHFNCLYVEPYRPDSLTYMFSKIMEALFLSTSPQFAKTVVGLKESIVASSIIVYKNVSDQFKPTPAKSHYTYNLRDVSKVFQGVSRANPKCIRSDSEMLKLWAHECQRVFHDRLVSEEDQSKFMDMLKAVIKEKFKRDWSSIVEIEPLLFSSFVPTIYPDNDTTKRPYLNLYCELTDREKLKKIAEDSLSEFNDDPENKKMDLVLFMSAIEHVVKIFRIITTPLGNGLLVGVGGSGRKSLTQLATHIAVFERYQIEISKSYDQIAWWNDMRIMMQQAGVDEKPTVFMFSDTQIILQTFVEDINNILNNGEIPNLFSDIESYTQIMDGMKDVTKGIAKYKKMNEQQLFDAFKDRCKNNLHVILTFSPIGEDFRKRLRMFPSLVNCTTIDWFLPWPEEALTSVASYFLETEDLGDNKEGIVKVCVDMQMRARNLTQRYYNEWRKYYYVTPTSYLELIQTFKGLLQKKRDEIDTVINKFTKGLKQLNMAKDEVQRLEGELQVLQPQLEVKQKETNELLKVLDVQKKDVAKQTKEVQSVEDECKGKTEEAQAIEADCQEKLAKVEPIFKQAVQAVKSLNKGDITEFRGIKKPSDGVVLVTESLCVLHGIPPTKKRGETAKAGITWDYWEPAKKNLLNAKLLGLCEKYPKDDIEEKIIDKIRPMIESPEYDEKKLIKASSAAAGLGKWVKAIYSYHEAMKIVNPKREELKGAQESLRIAKEQWDGAKAMLAEVEAKVRKLEEEFTEAEEEKKKLQKQKDTCEFQMNRAKDLTTKLADEDKQWNIDLNANHQMREHLLGDVLVSSGVVAYLGVFVEDYRVDCIEQWGKMMKEFGIIMSENYALQTVLGNSQKIQQWRIDKLPNDDVSTDNAIIKDNTERWPLMIDPQMQANIWIKEQEKKAQLQIIKPTTSATKLYQTLENSFLVGNPVILEDATEALDPMLEPLLDNQPETQAGVLTMKLGDSSKEFSKDFRFYITTKLSRPHYSPEVCVKVCMLNFEVTERGLIEQMLSLVVKHEDYKKYEQRINCIDQQAKQNEQKTQLQDTILSMIAGVTGNILEDDELIRTLDESKKSCETIEISLQEMKTLLDNIEKTRTHFKPIARRVARFFFCLSDMSNVDPMYQYSLKWYEIIFERALQTAEPGDQFQRIETIIRQFTKLIYLNVCRSLFEKDKLLFSFLMCKKVKEERDEINAIESRFLLAGGLNAETDKQNPASSWLSEKAWITLEEMDEKLPNFKDLSKEFAEHVKEWQKVYESPTPQDIEANPWPGKWNQLDEFKRLLVLRVIRPDKIVLAIQNLIINEKEMGELFVKPPPFDLQTSFEDSKHTTPIIFVLSSGADPMKELFALSQKPQYKKHPDQFSLSLGQGQSEAAKEKFKQAKEQGEWVVLQNCHLAPSFMPELEKLIEEIADDEEMVDFRVWLTAMPSEQFPVSVLQNGVKITNEPPKGLKNNMTRAFMGLKVEEFEQCVKPEAYKKLVYGLCFFNALVLERRKYGPLGWNIQYQFSQSDLDISKMQLFKFLNQYDEIPWEALSYMVAEANYGGRVTDPKDRICISCILEDFYTPDILYDDYKFNGCEDYYAPPNMPDIDSYLEFIDEKMPLNDKTEVFGLHDNADITSAINDTNQLLGTVLSLQPRITNSGGKSQDDQLMEIAGQILEKLPILFDLQKASKKHPIRPDESMNTVLQQELLRFNKLLKRIRDSLKNVGKAIKGEIVMSADLEELSNSLFDNRVPEMWTAVSYPSLKPLGSYVNDFLQRLIFMQKWIDNGSPTKYWLSGFFFTQSFLTGTKQNHARKYTIPIDQIDFDFKVISDPDKYDFTKKPEDGCYIYGLFLEGCRWDSSKETLEESFPKTLFDIVPDIHFTPDRVADIPKRHDYTCPVYKQSKRAGTLSTTGHSTNFVLDIKVPIQEQHQPKHWIKRGVAMLTQLDD